MKNQEYRIQNAKDGDPTLIVVLDGKEVPLHSRISPLREGNSAEISVNPATHDLLILLGCGLGYSFVQLEPYISKFTLVLVIDILAGVERKIKSVPHTSFLADAENVEFITGCTPEEILGRFGGIIDFSRFRGIRVIEHPQSFRLFTDYYSEIHSGIKRLIDKKAGDRATIRTFGNLFLRNALFNIASLNEYRPVSSMFGKFSGENAVIVSSAPSVEENIPLLKEFRESIRVIAVDSALPVLRESGIRPDFVVSIDPQPRIMEHFLEHDGGDSLHIFSIVSPPEIVSKFGGCISFNSHPLCQIIEQIFSDTAGSIDSATGSVAGDAFLFAFMAGFDKIAMTGFDFSFTDNIIYARGSAYQKRYSEYFNNRLSTAESFNSAYIFRSSGALIAEGRYTRRSFLGYRDSLDSLIEEKNCRNITLIRGKGLTLKNADNSDMGAFFKSMGIPERGSGKHHSINGIASGKINLDLQRLKSVLSDKNIAEEIVRESLGTDVNDQIIGKTLRLMKKSLSRG